MLGTVTMKSEETGTTIVFDRDNGTALSLEDGVFYSAAEILNLQDRKRRTGQGITAAEHQEKKRTMLKDREQIEMFCGVFNGKVVRKSHI